MLNTTTIQNLLPNAKMRLKDNNLVLLISFFYNHPNLLSEDGWSLIKIGSENILIDKDTLQVCEGCEMTLEWNKDHINGVTLKSNLQGEELEKHWEKTVKFCENVRKDMNCHFDTVKIEELTSSMAETKINDDEKSCDIPHEQVLALEED